MLSSVMGIENRRPNGKRRHLQPFERLQHVLDIPNAAAHQRGREADGPQDLDLLVELRKSEVRLRDTRCGR